MVVYLITNKVNGHQYIGQTIRTLKERWSEHCKYTNECSALARAIRKYGKENFTIEVVYIAFSIEELNKKEQEFIKQYDTFKPNGYNLTTGGLNYERSAETKRKFSEGQMGEKNHRFGKTPSAKSREQMSIAHMGESNHFFGKTHSPETRLKISNGLKEIFKIKPHGRLGKTFSVESRKKMSEAQKGEKSHMFGKHLSEEIKHKLSESRKGEKNPMFGKHLSKETKLLMSDKLKGRKFSDSHKSKIALNNPNRLPIICNETQQIFDSASAAAKQLGISRAYIQSTLHRKFKHPRRITFSYLSNNSV